MYQEGFKLLSVCRAQVLWYHASPADLVEDRSSEVRVMGSENRLRLFEVE